MGLDDFANALEQRAARLLDALPSIMAGAGQDLVALVIKRVVTEKETSTGGSFSPYSERDVPAFFYLGRGRRSSTDAKLRAKAKAREGVSYREFRELDGLDGSRKNFEFFGEMWRKTGVQSVARSGYIFTATIGGLSEAARQKLAWNSQSEGRSILEASRDEAQAVSRIILNRINQIR